MPRTFSRALLTALLVAAASLASASADAQDDAPDLAALAPSQAIAAMREMALYARYREALAAVNGYLERPDLSAHDRNAGLELLATVHIAMRDEAAAREVLARLFARDPGHRLEDPDASPPVLSAFARARSNSPEPLALAIDHTPPSLLERGPVVIEARGGEGADAIAELRLRYASADDTEFATAVMRMREGVGSAGVPLLERRDAYAVRYYIEALAPSGAVIGLRGSAESPLELSVPAVREDVMAADAPAPVAAGDDYLWVIGLVVGLAVVGAGVGVGVWLATDELAGPPQGSLGTIQLPLRF